ncbi:MAG: D-aminoacylase [Gemmatimonadota bacterium]|nr:D-aminoacylase [Gemmatimonadota bacterium]
MNKLSLLPIICISVLTLLSGCDTQPGSVSSDLIFTNAYVVDGMGEPGRVADVRVRGDRILEVGSLTPTDAETEIDATNLVLAPGFIDTHSHHDGGLEEGGALAAVSQGITTIIVGQDGGSPLPLSSFFTRLETATVAVNVAAYVGHNSIRRRVMGDDFRREATLEEIEGMKLLLEGELQSGALGLSTGLEYDPGIYSSTDEVVELARIAASVGGRYISHMRSEDREFFSALEELLHIGRETGIPVQVSHMKLAMKSLWGETGRVLSMLDAAREEGINVTADVYPYEFWQSTMTVLFPGREFTREAATFALEELAPPEGMFIAAFGADPSYVGMSLAEIAELRGKDAVTVYLELIAEADASDGRESIIARSMTETDIAELLSWPYTNVSSDGGLNGRHPRGYGSFTRVLGRHVREREELSLESAIQKMSSLAAENTGLSERGEIREGYFADLVLFDAETVLDRATPDEPNLTSVGVVGVWVNGARVYSTEGVTGNRPGRVLRRRDN